MKFELALLPSQRKIFLRVQFVGTLFIVKLKRNTPMRGAVVINNFL